MYIQTGTVQYPYGQMAMAPMAVSIPVAKFAGVASGVAPSSSSPAIASASSSILGVPLWGWGALAALALFGGSKARRR